MLKSRERVRLRKQLLGWFLRYQRKLPWRRDRDPYRIWLSEIMLQQTRVAAVIPYYERFLDHFPNIRALAIAPEDEVLRLWSGLGYYSRARNLQKAAQQIVAEYSAEFPTSENKVLGLPGIGPYTAAAILSIAHNKKMAVLDGNVARVLARLHAVRGDVRELPRWQSLQEIADALLAKSAPGDWNQAMMELGATVCTPRAPQCLVCPVSAFCKAKKLGIQELLPEKKEKRANVEVILAAAVFLDPSGHSLLLPPPSNSFRPKTSPLRAGKENIAALVSKMWHFPMVQVRKTASTELRQFLKISIPSLNSQLLPLATVRHAVTYRKIVLHPFLVPVEKLPAYRGARFVSLSKIDGLAISSLTRKTANAAASFVISSDFNKQKTFRQYPFGAAIDPELKLNATLEFPT
jgi:A/G-specific adenine glycosylase